jgi:putative ABC transport system permease protein
METLRIAIEALNRHKLRSFLTLLGVIIGVTTVVAVVSIITGLNNYVAEKVFQLNPDVFVVTRFGIITSREDFLEAVKRKKIDMSDMRAVETRCRSCGMIGANIQTRQTAKRGAEAAGGVQVQGATANMAVLNNLDLEAGRFYTEGEARHASLVTVIGSDVRERLFGRLDPIGRTIKLSGRTFRVVGLLRKQGSVLGQSQDLQLYIPLNTALKIYGTRQSLSLFIRPADGMPALQRAQDEVRVIIRSRRHTPFHGKDPFGIVTGEAVQGVWKNISAGAFALMIFISGISLAVGGIVIMNIMLVSVIERTREIGIRRALGARRSDIMWQFLTEAVLLSLGGGVVGVLIGAGISKVISVNFLPALVRPSLVITGLAVAVITGAAAGFFPARRAAKLAPVESLRYE